MVPKGEPRERLVVEESTTPTVSERFDRTVRTAEIALSPLAAIAAGLLVGAIAIALSGHGIFAVYGSMFHGVVGSGFLISAWLQRATPIVLAAVGAAVAFRAGLFNIGLEAQLVAGAMAAAVVGASMPVSGPVAIIAALVAGSLAGGLMGWIPGVLESRLGVSLVISTLLSNYIVDYVAGYLASGPFRDPTSSVTQTRLLPVSSQFGVLAHRTDFNVGMFVALVVVVIVAVLNRTSIPGFESRMRGLNPRFALIGGIDVRRQTSRIMAVSGAIVGLGGALATLAIFDRFINGSLTSLTGPGLAWTGLAAALMGSSEVVGAAVFALLLGGIQAGANFMSASMSVSLALSGVIQGTIIVFVAARAGFGFWVQSVGARLARQGASSP